MDPAYWRARWEEGKITFHQGRPNAQLEGHIGRLGPARRVFVPLCGKAEDMAFLAAHGHSVVGVEIAISALHDFFREHDLEPEVKKTDRFTILRGGPFTLLAGDFFALRPDDLGGANAAYDRGSIVALPDELRVRYADHVRTLLPARAPILTVTFTYDSARFEGPPFSVGEDDLRSLYGPDAGIEHLGEGPLPEGGALANANVGAMEKGWLVTL